MQARPVALGRPQAASAAAPWGTGVLERLFRAAAPSPAAADPLCQVNCLPRWPHIVHDIQWSLNPLPTHDFSTLRCFSPKLDASAATACFTPNTLERPPYGGVV